MKAIIRIAAVAAVVTVAGAQQPVTIQNIRPADARGINVFETGRKDTVTFTGTRIAFGGAFRQDFHGLQHSNTRRRP